LLTTAELGVLGFFPFGDFGLLAFGDFPGVTDRGDFPAGRGGVIPGAVTAVLSGSSATAPTDRRRPFASDFNIPAAGMDARFGVAVPRFTGVLGGNRSSNNSGLICGPNDTPAFLRAGPPFSGLADLLTPRWPLAGDLATLFGVGALEVDLRGLGLGAVETTSQV
jgi:hypothetical protein